MSEYEISPQPYYVMQTPDGKDLSNGSADYQNHSNPTIQSMAWRRFKWIKIPFCLNQHYSNAISLIFILGFTSINSYSQSDFIQNTFQGPHNLRVFHDYDMGMNYAKQINKLVLLDFNGYACVNCRKMESLVWVIQKFLKF